MAIIKCKMCGGDLNLVEGASTAQCEYCGSLQTIPQQDDEKKLIQFERAERLRKQCEFDKAAGIYETIVADFRQEAEAYWGLVLCKYGIEYVDDPATGKKIPTCHRSSFDSIMEDSDFEQVLENADSVARRVYREEAKAIEELRKGIIAVSANEEPYDIFICYKETAENGDRTLDSVLAQDVYEALTSKGYRVFFSRISLEDKLGVEYEPYIFAALNSAKIMLAFGTDYEYYNAVWVKNEWSRFLKLMAKDKEKHLIPCYKGIDAYDMPREFAKLQAQDLGKVGATQDLLRGIEKILPQKQEDQEAPIVQQVVAAESPTVSSYLKRAFLFLEDQEWASANEYCEKALDIDPENGRAYLGKLLAELHVPNPEMLSQQEKPFDERKYYEKAVRYGDESIRKPLEAALQIICVRCEQKRIEEEMVRQEHEKRRTEVIKKAQGVMGLIAAGKDHTVGVRSNSMVNLSGAEYYGLEKVTGWNDIVAVSAGNLRTDGLKSDGTVVTTGGYWDEDYDVSNWTDIVETSTAIHHTVGLKSNGTVVVTVYTGQQEQYGGQCEVSDWKDIIAVAAGRHHTIGLKKDGTVVATKYIRQ